MESDRLRWNDDERARLAAAALPLLIADNKLTIVAAVRRVQDTVLSPDRRRKLSNIGEVPTKLRFVLEQRRAAASGSTEIVDRAQLDEAIKRAEGAEQRALAIFADFQKAEARIAELESEVADARATNATLAAAPRPPSEMEVLERFLARVIGDALSKSRGVPGESGMKDMASVAAAVAAQEVRAAATVTAQASVRHGKHDCEMKSEERQREPVVMIVGLKPERRARFESMFAGRVRFKFWWSDGSMNPSMIGPKAKGADVVFCLMGACSHEEVHAATSNNDRVERVHRWSDDELRGRIDTFLKNAA